MRLKNLLKELKLKIHLEAFEQALENAKPALEVKSRRIGGATYQVPIEIPANRRASMAMRWIIAHSRAKSRSFYGRWTCQANWLIALTIKVRRLRKKMILTEWQKLIKLLPITSGNRRNTLWQDLKTKILKMS